MYPEDYFNMSTEKLLMLYFTFFYTKSLKSNISFILKVYLNSVTIFSLEILDLCFIFHKIYIDTHTQVVPNRLKVSQLLNQVVVFTFTFKLIKVK